MKKIFCLCFLVIFTACSSVSYNEFYKLSDNYLQQRQLSTRYFETKNEKELLIASVHLLQDLGYTIEESNTSIGLITASKNREILSDGKVAGMTALAVFAALFGTNINTNFPKTKELKATLISSKSNNRDSYNIRVEFASVTYYTQGNIILERNTDEKIYSDFFNKLGQSVFLTPNDI